MLQRLKTLATSNATIYRSYFRILHPAQARYFPSKETGLFIAAYPRSGNDYAKQMAKCYFSGLRISSHFHRPGAFKYASKTGVPVIGIVREPMECVSSCMVKRRSELSLESFPSYPMLEYLVYHRELLAWAERLSIVTFDELVGGSRIYIEKLQVLLGRSPADVHIDTAKASVTAKLEDRSLDCNQTPDLRKGPDEAKEALKKEARRIIEGDKAFVEEAARLYDALRLRG